MPATVGTTSAASGGLPGAKRGSRKLLFIVSILFSAVAASLPRFFGCSFTFDEGLKDNETLPYQVGA